MKKIVIFLLLAFTYGVAIGDDQKFINNSSSSHHDNRLSLFNITNTSPSIVMLGDSLTAYCEWKELFNDINIVNRGICGDDTYRIYGRIEEVIRLSPKKVFIMTGVNDFMNGNKPEQSFYYIKEIIKKLKNKKIQPVVQSVLNVRCDGNYAYINDNINKLNNMLKLYCKVNNITYIDINSVLSRNGCLKHELSNDGVHINGEGYRLWATAISNYIYSLNP